jgi:hypothetical protein
VHNRENNKPVSSKTKSPNRKERRKKLHPEEPKAYEALHRHPLALMVKKVFSSLLFWLIFFISVGSFLFLGYPRVSVHPASMLNSDEPFQIPFVIKNDGYLPLREVQYSLSLENIEFGHGNTLPRAYSGVNETHLTGLAPKGSSTISLAPFIDLLKQSFGIVLPPKSVTSAELAIDLSYQPYLMPFSLTERIRFKTTISSTGGYVWSEYRGQK